MSLGSSLLWLNTNQPGGFFPFLSISFGRASICGQCWRARLLFQAEKNAHRGIWWIALFISHLVLQQCTRSLQDTCATLGIISWVAWRRARYSPSWGMEAARSCCSWSTSEKEFIHLVLYFLLERNPASRLLQGPILSTEAVCWLSFLP